MKLPEDGLDLMEEDFYAILNCNAESTAEEIKEAYKRAALRWHPDKNQGQDEANEAFQRLSEAYSVLGNEEKRRKYDAERVQREADDQVSSLKRPHFMAKTGLVSGLGLDFLLGNGIQWPILDILMQVRRRIHVGRGRFGILGGQLLRVDDWM